MPDEFTRADRSVMPVAYRNTPNATSPDTSASNFLHNFKGFGLKFTLLGVGSGNGRTSASVSDFVTVPPQEVIISSTVTASGIKCLAIRLAGVV